MYTQVLCKQEDEIFVLFLLLKKYTEENVLMLDIRNLNQPSKPHHSMDLMRPIYQASLIAQLVKNPPANAGNPGSIPGSERAPAEGIGYPLQYSWASLVAQLVKKLPAMRETWVQSLGWEDPLENGKATHSSLLACRIQWTVQSMGSQRVRHN